MRHLVPSTTTSYDNPSGSLTYPYLPPTAYEAVFDFGCGCGRVARRLMLQRRRPSRYVGIDLHAGMINWCRKNLAPQAPEFTFLHHDVYNVHFNPGPTSRARPRSRSKTAPSRSSTPTPSSRT